MLKKSQFLCPCGGFKRFSQHSGPLPISPHASSRACKPERFQSQCRRFAHVHGSHSLRPDEDLSWPTHPNFTPYDLFKLDRNAPYSKRRFYELAKIYHPDLPCNGHPLCKGLSDSVRLHRYRLLVAAHEILSDPVKRAAYDKFGEGWHHRTELFGTCRTTDLWKEPPFYPKYTRTSQGADPIFRNATWEDWEAWHHSHNGGGGPQATIVSHNTFATFVILIALFVGTAQVVAIGRYSNHVEERVNEVHEKCSRFLNGRRQQTLSQLESKEERIQSFLTRRDPSGYGLREGEAEEYRRLLGNHRTTREMDDIEILGKGPPVANDSK
ncbi:hypothetical protein VTO42DRAFT_5317 [Malbranchea cinnamomea]